MRSIGSLEAGEVLWFAIAVSLWGTSPSTIATKRLQPLAIGAPGASAMIGFLRS